MVSNNRWRLVDKLEDKYYHGKAFCAVWVAGGIYVNNRSKGLPRGRLMFVPLENLKQFTIQHKDQFELCDDVPFGIIRCKKCGKEHYVPTKDLFDIIMIDKCSQCGTAMEENWEYECLRDEINELIGN